jgi:hypothetical protein
MTVTLPLLYVLLVLGALPQEPVRCRLAMVGLVPYAVGMASYAVAPGSGVPRVIAAAARTSGAVFFGVNAGLLALGALLSAAAAVGALRENPRSLRASMLLVISGFVLLQLRALAAASGIVRSALAVVGAGAALALTGAVVRRLRRIAPRGDAALRWPAQRGHVGVTAAFIAGALGVALGPHAGLAFLGLMVAAAADHLGRLARGQAGFPWLPLVTLGLLPIWWLLATIAGPVGLGFASLGDVPLSRRAEVLLGLPLALVVWSSLALWPAHRLFPGGLLAPLGVALWLRVARPALADGLVHWQPLLMPLGVLGVWGGAIAGPSAAALNALAFVALTSADGGSSAAALLLTAAALALGASRSSATPAPLAKVGERLAWAVAVLALPLVLEAGFRRQVVYTLAAAGGAALALWLGLAPEREGRDASGPDAGAIAA